MGSLPLRPQSAAVGLSAYPKLSRSLLPNKERKKKLPPA
jgi:hypothetical protein